jgi:hypothetical protein
MEQLLDLQSASKTASYNCESGELQKGCQPKNLPYLVSSHREPKGRREEPFALLHKQVNPVFFLGDTPLIHITSKLHVCLLLPNVSLEQPNAFLVPPLQRCCSLYVVM